ncbi:PROTEIN putative-RELATED [Salix purpurea]|uniref:PROTEIN putative-RELATED n=1 Tax=Salix purpurea TaxID=77065 RepID=A0A9Q0WVV9_SALPP|nr:PROTEIN putative-RELATED [Salix purpurea]
MGLFLALQSCLLSPFLLIFSLLSTAAVVYTIACIYTAREVTFKKVMSVVPKVWKRLMITFLSIFIAVFLYNVVSILVLITCVFLIDPSPSKCSSNSRVFWYSILHGACVHDHNLAIGKCCVSVGRGFWN